MSFDALSATIFGSVFSKNSLEADIKNVLLPECSCLTFLAEKYQFLENHSIGENLVARMLSGGFLSHFTEWWNQVRKW